MLKKLEKLQKSFAKLGREKKANLLSALLIVLALLVGGWTYRQILAMKIPEDKGRPGTSLADLKQVIYKPGQDLVFHSQTMKVNSAKSSDSINAGKSSITPEKGKKFLIISQTITVTAEDPTEFMPYQLFNSEGERYPAFASKSLTSTDYLYGRILKPNTPETGQVVFEVPQGAKEFWLGAHKKKTSELHLVEIRVN